MKLNAAKANVAIFEKIENLTNKYFKELGDCIGDYLMLTELTTIKDPSSTENTQHLIDKHALKGDKLLSAHRTLLIENIENFVKSVSEELK